MLFEYGLVGFLGVLGSSSERTMNEPQCLEREREREMFVWVNGDEVRD